MLSSESSINDLNQIHVNAEDWDDNRKRLFEKRVGTLLHHGDFLLIHVPEEGSKMNLIKPANNAYHRNRMIQRINECEKVPSTWHALSHMWGTEKIDEQLWRDISEHVNDEDGNPIDPVGKNPIWMRPEKRGTILKLLRDNPDSYWWIDVLCARTDTPLDIMGDIYACCTQSIAMIDCEPDIIPQIHEMKDYDPSFSSDTPPDEYSSQYDKLNDLFLSLTRCKWWKRVWTWQEMVLPQDILFMSEKTDDVSDHNMLHMGDLEHFETMLGKMISTCLQHGLPIARAPTTAFKELRTSRSFNTYRVSDKKELSSLITLFDTFGGSSRQCMDPADYVYGVLGVLQFDIPRITGAKAVWHEFLSKLDNFVAEHVCNNSSFTGMEESGGAVPSSLFIINERARKLDWADVRKMADVYRDLLIEYKCVA